MLKTTKKLLCLVLAFALIFSFSGCSKKVELTEENVSKTIEIAQTALQEFNTKDLKKYIDSKSLSYIIDLADKHDQFANLGKSMFENLSITVKSIDLASKTVTVDVMNKDLFSVASNYTYNLTHDYSTMQLVSLINDDAFLDMSLQELNDGIKDSQMYYEPQTVTLQILDDKKNLVISVDEEAENAISGGALSAITSIIG